MTQRALSIVIEEQTDGRKRRVQRVFDASGFAGLSVQDAGTGFLAIVAQLNQELVQGVNAEPPKAETPKAEPKPQPKDTDPNPTFRKPKLKDWKKGSGKSPIAKAE